LGNQVQCKVCYENYTNNENENIDFISVHIRTSTEQISVEITGEILGDFS
jgi:hypothetical protein